MKKFNPEAGMLYTYNNPTVGKFWCISSCQVVGQATLQNAESGWTFVAHGCRQYKDGTIDWAYSSGRHFRPLDLSLGIVRA